MGAVTKSIAATCLLASLVVSGAAAAGAVDFRARQREQIRFFQKLQKFGHPFQPRLPPAAALAEHAGRPRTPPTPAAGALAPAAAASEPVAAAAAAVAPMAFAGGTASFYLSPHPDDFVLFTFPYRDVVAPDTKVVFIFMTAGDAGLGTGPTGASYYLARENAAIKGIRFMADSSRPWAEGSTVANVSVNGRTIRTVSYRSTVAYFLRLPDGNGDGGGFPGTGNVSLSKLYDGRIATLRAVNGSTTYRGWSDLVNTIAAIVSRESSGMPNVWLNTNDPNAALNPGDHADHLATGSAAAAVQPLRPCVNAAYHVGYALAGLANLSRDEALNKSGSFASYATGLTDKNYFGAWDDVHKSWLTGLSARVALGNGAACAL